MIKPAFVEQFCPTPIRRLMTCSFGSFGEPIGPRAQEWHTTGSGLQLSKERERHLVKLFASIWANQFRCSETKAKHWGSWILAQL